MTGYEIKETDVREIIKCMENVAGVLSVSEMVSVKQNDEKCSISSMEISQMFKCPHINVFNAITKFVTTEASENEKEEFRFGKRVYRQNRTHGICYLTKKGCDIYIKKICSEKYHKSKNFIEGAKMLENEVKSRFRNESMQKGEFLMDGRSRAECEKIKEIFDRFITGPGLEKREIAELTQKYKEFHDVMKDAQMQAKQSNAIEEAVYGVAIEAEMQGFIYGFKLYEELVNRQLVVA